MMTGQVAQEFFDCVDRLGIAFGNCVGKACFFGVNAPTTQFLPVTVRFSALDTIRGLATAITEPLRMTMKSEAQACQAAEPKANPITAETQGALRCLSKCPHDFVLPIPSPMTGMRIPVELAEKHDGKTALCAYVLNVGHFLVVRDAGRRSFHGEVIRHHTYGTPVDFPKAAVAAVGRRLVAHLLGCRRRRTGRTCETCRDRAVGRRARAHSGNPAAAFLQACRRRHSLRLAAACFVFFDFFFIRHGERPWRNFIFGVYGLYRAVRAGGKARGAGPIYFDEGWIRRLWARCSVRCATRPERAR